MTPEAAPPGWRRARYGDALAETDERAGERTHLPVLSVTKSRGPMLASERFGKTMHARDLSRYRVAPRNHVVADPMLLWDGSIGIQRVVDAGLVSPDYRVYKPTESAEPAFIAYLIRSPLVLSYYQGGARGTNVRRNRIARADFLSIPVSLPPLGEQRKIAAILSSVDDAVEATQAVIDQLQVLKKAMMVGLLARGLPRRHLRFKQTEIGELPAEWGVVRLEEVAATSSGGTPSRDDPSNYGGDIPWVKSGEVESHWIETTEETISNRGLENSAAKWVDVGAVLVAMYGATAGRVGRLGIRATTNQAVCAIKASTGTISDEFIYWVLLTSTPTLLRSVQGSGQPNLNAGMIKALMVPVPTREEQDGICRALEEIARRLIAERDALSAIVTVRAALMSGLLTGELRVTPDEAAA